MQPANILLPRGAILHDRYVIDHTISSGGFGNVYFAHDRLFDRDVAIKEAYFSDEDTRAQFDFEAQVLIHTLNPGIVRGFETFEQQGRFYLVMQYISGQNLEEMQFAHFEALQRPMPEAQVLRVMVDICAATHALHGGHVLHRDIKPANIKVNADGQPILLDLGLAKLYKSPDHRTLIAAQAYTPGYAPPEQCEENGVTTERTDVYALGATTYYALTGRQPWESTRRLSELYARKPDMLKPSQLVPGISPATDALVMHAMALTADDRFPTAAAMQAVMVEALRALQVVCPTCGTPNDVNAEYCGQCGTHLRAAVSGAAVGTPLQQAAAQGQRAAPVVTSQTTPMLPLKPEPVRARVVVTSRPSTLSRVVLILGALALCPATGWLLWVAVLPLGVTALRHINSSHGLYRGRTQATVGMLFGLAGLAIFALTIFVAATGSLPFKLP